MRNFYVLIFSLITISLTWACIPEGQNAENSLFESGVEFNQQVKPQPEGDYKTDALNLLNYYREIAGLSDLEYDVDLEYGLQEHLNYMRENDIITHTEDKINGYYTEIGEIAGSQSLLAKDVDSIYQAIEFWINSLYHRLPILNPQLMRIALIYQDGYALLNVKGGRDRNLMWQSPVTFPAPMQMDVLPEFSWHETPDPLPENVELPVGNFITIMFPNLDILDFDISDIKLYDGNGYEIEIFIHLPDDPFTPNQEFLRNTVAILPLEPLLSNTTYTAEVNGLVNERSFYQIWSFRTGA